MLLAFLVVLFSKIVVLHWYKSFQHLELKDNMFTVASPLGPFDKAAVLPKNKISQHNDHKFAYGLVFNDLSSGIDVTSAICCSKKYLDLPCVPCSHVATPKMPIMQLW